MRNVRNAERVQRGCKWCEEWESRGGRNWCPYETCPYHELDKHKTYTDYLESIGGTSLSKILMNLGLGKA